MEIEKKFTIKQLPDNLSQYPYHIIEQAYLNTEPVIRIRREDEHYYLTYKGSGLISREEYNLPLNETSYHHLLEKADGNIISKKRYLIPLSDPQFKDDFTPSEQDIKDLMIELDLFESPFDGLIIAEVEFPSLEMCEAFLMPDWFLEDVSENTEYHNSNLSKKKFHE